MDAALCRFAERLLVVFTPIAAAMAADRLVSALLPEGPPQAAALAAVLALFAADLALLLSLRDGGCYYY